MAPPDEHAARILSAAARRGDRRGDGTGPGLALLGLEVRSTTGAPLADPVLARVEAAAVEELRDGDVLTHLGSGRFAILLTGLWDLDAVGGLAQRLRASAIGASPSGEDAPAVAVATVVGLDPGADMRDALDRLATLLPPSTPGLTSSDPGGTEGTEGTEGTASRVTGAEVVDALADGRLAPYYQPVADLSGRAAGAEALLRWDHPRLGVLAPADFLDVALGAVGPVALGETVLAHAVAQVASWERVADLSYYRVGINLAPPHLEHGDVARRIESLLEEHGVSGHRLLVEILESDAICAWDRMSTAVLHLRAMGLRVAIDDFGSGHAGVDWLRDLPIDMVKVDRALVGLSPDAAQQQLLAAVIRAARATGADVLLEGVETLEQLALAQQAGATFVQGLLVGPPQPPGPRPVAPLPLPTP